MKNDQILSQISEFCRQADMAESTFGRRAVNDGKLVHRLREGKRITIDTLDRIQAYIAASMPGGVPPPRGLEVACLRAAGAAGLADIASTVAAEGTARWRPGDCPARPLHATADVLPDSAGLPPRISSSG